MSKPYQSAPTSSTKMPSGIPYIIANEVAERFSFYGMKTILFVFMTKYLLDAAGNTSPMSPEDAKKYLHLFVAASYIFPIIGAIISDAIWGKYRTILILSLLYCAGHLVLALDDLIYLSKEAEMFTSLLGGYETRLGLLTGLLLISMGAGGIKPCVSAHVGDQFGTKNQHLLPRVFGWFYFSINLGAFSSTMLTPWLLATYGPGLAFGVPGILMFLATIVFWLGRHQFVHVPPGGWRAIQETFSGEGLRAILNLGIIYLFVAVFWSLFDQTGSSWIQQAESMNLNVFGMELLPSQIQAANPMLIMILIPIFSYVIYPAINKVFELTPLRKISIGLFVTVLAFGISAFAESLITGGRVIRITSKLESDSTGQELLDSEANNGWTSTKLEINSATSNAKESETFPQEIVIQLRERKAWEINQVILHPHTKENSHADSTSTINPQQAFPKDVEVLVSDSPNGNGKSITKQTLASNGMAQTIEFDPENTKYVTVRIHSNHGAEYVSIGEIEVHSPVAAHSDLHQHAEQVWPNVAAVGYRPTVWWQLLAYLVITAAEVMVSITCLEFSYTQAPNKMKSMVMSLYLLSVAAGNLFTSFVNDFIQNPDGTVKLSGANYYWFFTIAMLVTAILFVIVAQFYRGKTYIQKESDADAE